MYFAKSAGNTKRHRTIRDRLWRLQAEESEGDTSSKFVAGRLPPNRNEEKSSTTTRKSCVIAFALGKIPRAQWDGRGRWGERRQRIARSWHARKRWNGAWGCPKGKRRFPPPRRVVRRATRIPPWLSVTAFIVDRVGGAVTALTFDQRDCVAKERCDGHVREMTRHLGVLFFCLGHIRIGGCVGIRSIYWLR
jgi:hypothetical protein